MAVNKDDLYRAALTLDDNQRAELAALLITSLEGNAEAGVDLAWRTEIERRMKELDTGAVQAVSWGEARQRLFSKPDA
jgi:putative addiction module component (TIGR02574 family)